MTITKDTFTSICLLIECSTIKTGNKTGKVVEILLETILLVQKVDDQTSDIISGKEWAYLFRIITRDRQYDFRAFSWNDREIWLKGFERLLDYKKKILARRSINIDDLKVNEYIRPINSVYHLQSSDFWEDGKIKPLDQIKIEKLQDPRFVVEEEHKTIEEDEEIKDNDFQDHSGLSKEEHEDKNNVIKTNLEKEQDEMILRNKLNNPKISKLNSQREGDSEDSQQKIEPEKPINSKKRNKI